MATLTRVRPGVRRVLVSNTNVLHWEGVLRVFDPSGHFDALVLSFRVGAVKPESEFWDAALEAAGCAPGECLYADDRPELVAAAAARGIPGFVVRGAGSFAAGLDERGLLSHPRRSGREFPGPSNRSTILIVGSLQMLTIRLLATVLLALLSMTACARPEGRADESRSSGPGVAFASGSFDEALARARSEKRLLLVDVYTDWCGWCKKLDRDVFGDARVAEASRGLVAVRINAEKGGEKVAQRYDVQGYPTILFVDGSGNVVKRIDGYVDAAEMLQTSQGASEVLTAPLPSDGDLLARGLAALCEGRFFEAHEEWEQVWRRTSGTERRRLQGLIQLAAAGVHLRKGRPGPAMKPPRPRGSRSSRTPRRTSSGFPRQPSSSSPGRSSPIWPQAGCRPTPRPSSGFRNLGERRERRRENPRLPFPDLGEEQSVGDAIPRAERPVASDTERGQLTGHAARRELSVGARPSTTARMTRA